MLNAQEMVREAKSLVKLDRFDADDVEYNLGRLVDAINTETTLNEAGQRRFHVAGVYLLCNRLLLNKVLEEHAELRDADIGEAIMIVGLPRTGSTKLQRLIAQDSRLDHMTLLDVTLPLAFPGESGTEIRSRLVANMEQALGQPQLLAAHNLTAAEPEEELELQKSHFTPRSMRDMAAIPQWVDLMKTLDVRPKYELVRQYIVANKMQRNRRGMAWIFKNAYAGEDVDVIAEVFPNAKFVFTHRDPVEQVGSITAIGHKWREFNSDVVSKAQTGAEYLYFWGDFIKRTMAALERLPAERVIHVRYRDVLKNPLETVNQIYDFCGYELTPQAEQSIREYDRQNAQHQHGKHSYTLEEFGLSSSMVRDAFADYLKMYGDKV